jgi:hypothetical protein
MGEDAGYLADDEASEVAEEQAVDESGYLADTEDGYGSGEGEDGNEPAEETGAGGDDAPGGGQIDRTIGQGYAAVLEALDGQAELVGARYGLVRQTIEAAALIDANAALIAAAGDHARQKVEEVTGLKPSSGFANESAEAIASRAGDPLGMGDDRGPARR